MATDAKSLPKPSAAAGIHLNRRNGATQDAAKRPICDHFVGAVVRERRRSISLVMPEEARPCISFRSRPLIRWSAHRVNVAVFRQVYMARL